MIQSIKALKIMSGGGLLTSKLPTEDIIEVFLYSLIMLLVKGFLVMVTFNTMVPRIAYSFNQEYDISKFTPISIWEVILFLQ